MRSLLIAALLAVAAPASAQSLYPTGWKPVTIQKWGGLNLLQDSSMIDGDAQQAINVFTDNTYLEKRSGNLLLATILAGFPVQYVSNWYAPNGSQYLIAQASQTVYETNFSGAPVALSTIAQGYNLTTVPAFSKLEFADGSRRLWFWNDNSTGTVSDANSGLLAPICNLIAYKDSRIWCTLTSQGFSEAGNTTNGGGQSTVLLSSSGGDGFWAVPSNVSTVDNAPNRFDLNPDDGDQIICMAPTPWGMYVGKRYSSYIIKGNGNLTYDPRLLDPKIGCVDNRSVQMVYGVLHWLSIDGVYGYTGAGAPQLLSRDLDPLMNLVREETFSQGTWLTELQPDWRSGTVTTPTGGLPPRGSWDFQSIPNEIFPSSFTLFDDNTNPAVQHCTTSINPGTSLPWNCGVGFSSDTLVFVDTMTAPLSIGYAQLAPGPNGVSAILSDFTQNCSGTAFEGVAPGWYPGYLGQTQCDNSNGPSSYLRSLTATLGSIYSTAASTMPVNNTNGNMTGFWDLQWGVLPTVTGNGACSLTANQECIEFNFINTTIPSAVSNSYGLRIDQTADKNTLPVPYTLTFFKKKLGSQSTLATYNFTYGTTTVVNVPFYFPNLGVSRTSAGQFVVYLGTIPVIDTYDTDASVAISSTVEMRLANNNSGGFGCAVVVSTFNYLGYSASGSILSRIFDSGIIVPFAGVFSATTTTASNPPDTSVKFAIRSSTSPNNDKWGAWQNNVAGTLVTGLSRYWQYESTMTTVVSSETPTIQSVNLVAITTGSYYSKVDFIGTLITSWRQFGVDENTPGVYNYWVRSATYAFAPGATSPAWTSQTANVNVVVATGSYAQFQLDSTSLLTNPLGANAAEPILSVALNWNQGQDLPVASSSLNRRYMLCVTISTSATAPDTCLIRQKNGKWVQWSNNGTIGAMGIYNNQIIAADGGTSSNVWQILQPNVYNDNGVPISALWVGADITDGIPFNLKTYYGVMIDAQPVQASSVTFSYQVNKSSGFVNQPFTTDNGQGLSTFLSVIGSQYGSIDKWLSPVNGYNQGYYVRYEFSDNNLDDYFRINDFSLFIKDEPWQEPGPY